MKSKALDFAEVKRVCQDCTLAGLKAMYEAGPSKPFRFLYFSADGISRDATQKPLLLGEFRFMRVSISVLLSSLELAIDVNNVVTCSIGRDRKQGTRIWRRA